jgi:TetR/AcrR family transcriptional regulator
MSIAPPSRRQRERERHRDEILEAALRVLTTRGMDGLTIEAVAREAEFAVGSLYRHFSSKEAMVESLFLHLTEPLFQDIEALATASGPFDERLERWVASALSHAKGEVPLLKLFFASSSGMPVPGSRLKETRDRYFRAIDALVASGQSEGAVAAGDRVSMDLCLFGMVSGFMRAMIWDDRPTIKNAPAVVRRAFLEGFGPRDEPTSRPRTRRRHTRRAR